jgi:hypothetical protein
MRFSRLKERVAEMKMRNTSHEPEPLIIGLSLPVTPMLSVEQSLMMSPWEGVNHPGSDLAMAGGGGYLYL